MELTAQDLTPIFHSETSSSYLLMRYLNRGVNALRFVALVHALDPDFLDPAGFTQGEVEREYFYKDQGSVDLRIPLAHPSGRKAVVLVEVKVHDQASATRDQIGTYFKAEQGATGADVYFVYLTQFTRRSLEGAGVRKEPRTLTEFGRAKREFGFRETLLELAGHCDHWPLLGFFSRIFAFAHAQRNLRLFGGGNFAIHFWSRAEKASRSLCTLYPKTMEITFQLRR